MEVSRFFGGNDNTISKGKKTRGGLATLLIYLVILLYMAFMTPSSTEKVSGRRRKRVSEGSSTQMDSTPPRPFKKSRLLSSGTNSNNPAEFFKPATPSTLHSSIGPEAINNKRKDKRAPSRNTIPGKSNGKKKKIEKKKQSSQEKPIAKRPKIPGKLRRLGLPRTHIHSGELKTNKTIHGNPIHGSYHGTGNFTSSSSVLSKKQNHQLWITRKTNYSVYLKTGIAAFISKNARSLELHALGAAIPMCLSLALAITDALPCGQDGISTRITTGSEPVVDEIIPEEENDNDTDIVYQTRVKSTIHVHLSLKTASST